MRKPTELPAALKSIDVKAVLRKRGIYELQEENHKLKAATLPVARQLVNSKKAKALPPRELSHPTLTNDQVMAYWQKQIHMVEVVEAKLQQKLEQFIDKIGKEFVKSLHNETKGFFDEEADDFIVQAGIDFRPLLENIAILAGNEANKLIGVKEPYLLYNYREQIAKNVEFFAKSMLDTDKEHLTNLLTNGIESGKSIPEIAGLIEADFSEYSKMQATRITRTEVLRASNEASIDAYIQSGVVEGKQWLTAGAVDECASYEGKVVDLEDDFGDGDPPLHPNCRCVVLPVLKGEKGFVTAPVYEKDLLANRIAELEKQLDKRTKEFRELKDSRSDDVEYIKELEGLVDAKRAKIEIGEV